MRTTVLPAPLLAVLISGCETPTDTELEPEPGNIVVTVDVPLVGERRTRFHAEAVVTVWREGHKGRLSDGRVNRLVPESGIVEFDSLEVGGWHVALIQPRIEGWGDGTTGWRGYPTNDTVVNLGYEMVTVPRTADYSPVIGETWDIDDYTWRITTGLIDPTGEFTAGETEIKLAARDSVVAAGAVSGSYDYPNLDIRLQILGGCTATGTVVHDDQPLDLTYTKIDYTHIRIVCPAAGIDVQWP